ncbi:hypothetical protein Tco_1308829, partial [Tanacetum coccineum]
VRIEKTKRSKNDQKPTRNGKKTKSKEQDKEFSQKSQPDQSNLVKERNKGSQKLKITSQRAKDVKFSKFKGYFEVLKSQGLSLPSVERCFVKKK